MTDTYTCPVSGCDYGDGETENKSLAAVRSHINASSGPDHDWDALKAEVKGETEQAEASETEENGGEDTDANEDEDMPTPEELEHQRQRQENGPEDDDTDTVDQQPVDGSGGIPISTTTAVVLAALVVAVVIAYRVRSSGSTGADQSGSADGGDEIDAATDGLGGGLVDE